MIRGIDAGLLTWSVLGHAAYLLAMGLAGLSVTARRLSVLLLP